MGAQQSGARTAHLTLAGNRPLEHEPQGAALTQASNNGPLLNFGRHYAKPVVAASRVHGNAGMNKPSISVVEDNDSLRITIVELLAMRGLTARGFSGLDDFFAAMAQSVPDVIVSDVYLGSSSGFELIDKLRGSALNIPVIFMSGSGHQDMDRLAREKGACAFLQKPFTIEQLLNAIDRAQVMANSSAQPWCRSSQREFR